MVYPPIVCAIASPPRTDHAVMRRSKKSNIRYMPTPITPTTTRAANTSGTLKLELATSITLPMPLLPATISAITEPTKASVTAIFSEAKKNGMERGIPILRVMSQRVAPSERITSKSSGSMVANAVATLATTGKNDSMNAVNPAVSEARRAQEKAERQPEHDGGHEADQGRGERRHAMQEQRVAEFVDRL